MKPIRLQFNTITEVAYFLGPTVITGNDGTVLNADQGGVYRTQENIADFSGAAVETPTYRLYGDELFGDKNQEYYTATNNVSFISKEQNIIITGDFGRHWKSQGLTKVYGNALMKRVFETDTLFLSADTLISIEDPIPSNERLLAFNNVKIFKPDLQGKADSLSYRMADSLMYLYDDPVLWNQENQMESDTISMVMADGRIDRMFLDSNAFVAMLSTEDYYNQVKGRKMVAFFKQSKLSQVDVNGNGESLYFELQEEDSLVMGMNKVLCSDMRLKFKDQNLTDITFYSPDGSFIPFHEIKAESTKLEGFSWRQYERPTRYSVLGASQGTPPIILDNPPLPSNAKPVEVDVGAPKIEELQKLQQN